MASPSIPNGSFYVADTSEAYIGLDRGSRSIQKFVRR